ncbi:Sip1-related alpha-galactosidase [Paenibacillaceae bacterium WGS1546]|uniref:Sip1-related alpha-galactosidase n=1 Tax=Cohnella sp. WGS1546 TaxID=3366810 RepID=UPI00372D5DE8
MMKEAGICFMEREQSLDLAAEGRPLMQGLEVLARLRDGREVRLRARSVVCSQADFEDGEGLISARLRLKPEGEGTAVFVQAVIRNQELFRDLMTFAPENGIVVRVRDIPDALGAMANYRHKDWWTRPFFSTDWRRLPPRTLSLLWKSRESYTHLLTACGAVYRTELGGGEDGVDFGVSAGQGGFSECDTLAWVMSRGSDPLRLAESNARAGLNASGAAGKLRSEKAYPEMLEYLGWCSWDAFYHQVNAEGLLKKTGELNDGGVPVKWIMIDDGWSDTGGGKRLRSYDAAPDKFPGGLAEAVREMKRRHGVHWVGVWHTIAGYWGGIDPNGELFATFGTSLCRASGGAWVPKPETASAFAFWNGWHAYLKRQGVDFVKVDSQSAVANFYRDQAPIGEAARASHAALEASVGLHFQGCVINCMGMAPENVWHRPASSVSRSSDDFVPDAKDGFKEHALQNAYNSYFHGSFYWGDWDMYWTKHDDALRHMILRAVSGGPVYFSDKPGRTDGGMIRPLVYRNGKIIRCDQPGLPTEDVLTRNPTEEPVPLKIWNRLGRAGVLAAFHIYRDGEEVAGDFGPADIPGLEGDEFWAYEYVGRTLTRMRKDERAELKLGSGEAALYALIPKEAGATPLGLIDKAVCVDAVAGCWHGNGKTLVTLKEGGSFAFAADESPVAATVNGRPADLAQGSHESLYVVDCHDSAGETVIEIIYR